MQKKEFSFTLPNELIAKFPTEQRTSSRLLCLNKENGEIADRHFLDVLDLLNENDLLVLNNTRVIPARLYGKKASGGAVEVLIERILDEQRVLAFVRASKSPKAGSVILFAENISATVVDKQDGLFELAFIAGLDLLDTLEQLGEMPLPPYMEREVRESDKSRYQTVFAEHPGAVAAPTAGLHFDENCLQAIKQKGVDTAYVTLHVGAGTFQPMRVDNILEHKMHNERIDIPPETIDKIVATKARGGRVVAVGTTVVRSLESVIKETGSLQPFTGETDIFIYPGYEFKVVDALITNFHLPESTLIMLVSAFAGKENVLKAYQHAIENRYRFYSYGDAMFISR